jgi:hypothetical protein
MTIEEYESLPDAERCALLQTATAIQQLEDQRVVRRVVAHSSDPTAPTITIRDLTTAAAEAGEVTVDTLTAALLRLCTTTKE